MKLMSVRCSNGSGDSSRNSCINTFLIVGLLNIERIAKSKMPGLGTKLSKSISSSSP